MPKSSMAIPIPAVLIVSSFEIECSMSSMMRLSVISRSSCSTLPASCAASSLTSFAKFASRRFNGEILTAMRGGLSPSLSHRR
ncbi:hypothetical protein D3C83_23610 [compost metagenome]